MMAGVTTVASATVSTDRWLIMIETLGGRGIQHSIRGQGGARRTNGGDRWRTSGKHLWSGRMRERSPTWARSWSRGALGAPVGEGRRARRHVYPRRAGISDVVLAYARTLNSSREAITRDRLGGRGAATSRTLDAGG